MSSPGRFQSLRSLGAEKSARTDAAMRLSAGLTGLGSIIVLIAALTLGGHV